MRNAHLLAQRTANYFIKSREHLRCALRCGLIELLTQGKPARTETEVRKGIARDRDLKALFEHWPQLLAEVRNESPDLPTITPSRGGGCVDSAAMIASSTDHESPLGRVAVGDCVLSWNEREGCFQEAKVVAVRHVTTRSVLRINKSLLLTNVHPLRTTEGWKPAGEIRPAMLLKARDGWCTVQEVEHLKGTFHVVDITVEPNATFVVNGIVAHNKLTGDFGSGNLD
jgi:hypothetical protein